MDLYARFKGKPNSVFHMLYGFALFGEGGITGLFVQHRRAYPVRRVLGFAPTARFSGVVIYAKGSYPVFAAQREGALRPALFPRLFDERMEVVIERARCDPDALRSRGLAAYTDSLDTGRFADRIGSFPLQILARGIYGAAGTDIIIPNRDAERLLGLPENRELLRQGRILIVVDSSPYASPGSF